MHDPVYKIISATGVEALTKGILEEEAAGWQVFGGMCRVPYTDPETGREIVSCYQVVIKIQDSGPAPLVRPRTEKIQM